MTFNSCFERGRIEGFGYLEPATTTASPSATDLQTEAAKAIEERDFKLISKSWWQIKDAFFTFLLILIIYCSFISPPYFAFSLLHWWKMAFDIFSLKEQVQLALANNVFYNDCSAVASSRHLTRKMFIARLLFMVLQFNPSCPTPGILVFNFLINSGYFLHLGVIPSISKSLCIPLHC